MTLGKWVFALAAVLLGIVGLIWGDFASNWQPVPEDLPGRTAFAYGISALFLIAGAALLFRRTMRPAAIVLAVLYSIYTLLWARRVIGFPTIFATWGGCAEELCLVVAAILIAASTADNPSPRVTAVVAGGQVLFGLCAIAFGLNHFFALPQTAALVPAWIPPGRMFWAIATGVFDVLAGLAIVTGIKPILAARLLTTMFLGFGLLIWLPSLFHRPGVHMVWGGNAVNLAIIGAAWTTADSIAEALNGGNSVGLAALFGGWGHGNNRRSRPRRSF